jgi:hypothetical protein
MLSSSMNGFEKLIIDVSPCSTAPSTPDSETGKLGSHFDQQDNLPSRVSSDEVPVQRTVVQNMADSLKALYSTNAPQAILATWEDALMCHLHFNAVTPTDAKALVSTLPHNHPLMSKLVTNIS